MALNKKRNIFSNFNVTIHGHKWPISYLKRVYKALKRKLSHRRAYIEEADQNIDEH